MKQSTVRRGLGSAVAALTGLVRREETSGDAESGPGHEPGARGSGSVAGAAGPEGSGAAAPAAAGAPAAHAPGIGAPLALPAATGEDAELVGDPLLEEIEQSIVERMKADDVKVPPYPAIAHRIRELVARHDYGIDEVARLVSADSSLAADTLRCANSAMYCRGEAVTSVKTAVARVGSQEVVRLALASALAGYAQAGGPLLPLRRRAWIDSIASAAICDRLARRRRVPPEDGFICGLLHDFGKLVAIAAVEGALGARRLAPRPMSFWEQIVERFHVELGMVSAARWKLPPAVADTIAAHHAASADGTADPRLVQIVMIADAVIATMRQQPRVTRALLVHAGKLEADEAASLEAFVEGVPSFVASFEGSSGVAGASALSLISPPRVEAVPIKPVECALGDAGSPLVVTAHASCGDSLLARSGRALEQDALAKLEVRHGSSPFTCWVTVRGSWCDGQGAEAVLLQPFALGVNELRRWLDIVAA